MITYFTANYEDGICDNIIELWERDCKKYFMERRSGTWTSFLQVSAKLHKVWDEKRNLKIPETPKMIGKIETDTINIERSSNQYNSHKPSTNKPFKNDKKKMIYTSWSFESGKEKKFLVK